MAMGIVIDLSVIGNFAGIHLRVCQSNPGVTHSIRFHTARHPHLPLAAKQGTLRKLPSPTIYRSGETGTGLDRLDDIDVVVRRRISRAASSFSAKSVSVLFQGSSLELNSCSRNARISRFMCDVAGDGSTGVTASDSSSSCSCGAQKMRPLPPQPHA